MRHLLLLEDDLISLEFMAEAMRELPLQLHTAGTFESAQRLTQLYCFALIISDLNLSDGNLLTHYQQLPNNVPILAISAELNEHTRQALADIGIEHALAKPMRISQLHEAVYSVWPVLRNETTSELWDDEKAQRALGHNPQALANLKRMFAAELDTMKTQISQAFETGNQTFIQQQLHKLKASCGFLGAERLLQASHVLDHNPGEQTLQHFLEVLDETRATI
jgi:DNA-binding response OmpR family regulator